MKTFRELDQVIADYIKLSIVEFREKYDLADLAIGPAYGFYLGVCFALGREGPD